MVKDFIKKELSGWKNSEIIGIFIILTVVIFNAVFLKDSIIAVISAICGLMYTIIAGKGKISCYLFGLTGSGFYAYLAFSNALFGNFLLYVLYYIPMQILGIFKWKNHLEKETNEIYRTQLSNKERTVLFVFSVILCYAAVYILDLFGDSHSVADGVSTALSILGMYLTVRRCIEQWIIWAGVNLLGIIIWIKIILSGEKTYSTAFMWFVYFVLAIYFYAEWHKKLYSKSES